MRTAYKRISRGAAALLFVLSSVFVWIPTASAAPGDTPEDPIIITDCLQLQAIDENQANYSKNYALGSDIDCSDTANWNGWKGFNPIASNDEPFTGTFNGNHHTITNLTINRANDTSGYQAEDDEESVGLFAWTQNADIRNLNIDTSKVKGYAYVGGIVGWAETTTLTNVSFNATVADNSCDPGHCVWARYGYAGGGLVGMLHSSEIINGVTGGPVKGSGNTIGGLVGQMGNNSSIASSSSSSSIDGGNELGGAVGWMLGGTLDDVHASGSIDANDDESLKNGYAAGGLVGAMEGTASVAYSSATGSVHADYEAAGGLVGVKRDSGSITNSYARGNVTQSDGWTTGGKVGGLIGELYGGTINRTYSSGSVTGEYNVGGLIGFTANGGSVEVKNSFAAGQVTATEEDEVHNGGLIGRFSADNVTLENNYYDLDRTTMGHCYAWYPEGYMESPATIPGECMARNTDDIPNPNYFYNSSNQPFHDGEGAIWSPFTWDFHEDDYPTFECDQCEVIEDEETESVATLETLSADNITATSATMYGESYLHGGVTISDIPESLLVGFHLNTSPTVDWQNNTHSAPVDDVSEIEENDTHVAFSGEIDGLDCETQYWYVAAYSYNSGEAFEDGIADNIETFTTGACPVEDDNDGIATEVENAAPNNGDGNNDDTADSEQANVASFVNPTNNQYVTVVLDEECALSAVSATSEGGNWAKDEGFSYSSGFVNFTADCGEDGFTTPVSIYHYGVNKDGLIVRKYNPSNQTYFTINDASLSQETIGGQTVAVATYSVTDGAELDVDGEENGIIVDPVGLAAATATTVQGNTTGNLASTGANRTLLSFIGLLATFGSAFYLKRRYM